MPSAQDIRVSKTLTNYSVGYSNVNFIAEKVLPRVKELRVNPFAYAWDRDNFLLQNDYRAPGVKANEVTYGLTKGSSFVLVEHALKSKIPIEDMDAAQDADGQWDLKRDHVKLLNDSILTRHEYEVASLLFNVSTFSGYTSALSGNDQWDEYGTSDPVDDVYTAMEYVRQQIGIDPNTATIGKGVFRKLQNHPDILDRIKYTGSNVKPADVTAQALASIFGLDNVFVGSGVYNANPQGKAASMTDIWGKFCLISYINPNPSPMSPSLGYNYYDPRAEKVREWYNDEERAWYVEVSKKFLPKVNSTISGYLYSTVID